MHVRLDGGVRDEFDVRHYRAVLRRRKWIALFTLLGVVAATMAWTLTREPRYESTATLLISAPTPREADAQGLSGEPARVVANEIEVLGSERMQAAVEAELGYRPDVTATAFEDHDVIELRATGTDPEATADAVNGYADAYVDARRARALTDIEEQIATLEQDRAADQATVEELTNDEQGLDTELARLAITSPEFAQLDARHDAIVERRDELVGTVNELSLDIESLEGSLTAISGGVDVLNHASVPTEPYTPQPRKNAMVAVAVGLLLALAAAFLREHFDDAVRGATGLERVAGSVPVLGIIPTVPSWKDPEDTELVMRDAPREAVAESYRSLATSLEFAGAGGDRSVYQLTSPAASEGKTATVANLGVAFADSGKQVLLVDGDLRRPRLHDFFGVPAEPGLSTVLVGGDGSPSVVQPVPGVENLHLLPAGPVPPTPPELLHSDRFLDEIDELAEDYDVLIIDTPPVLPVTDALLVSRAAGAVMVIAREGATGRRRLDRTLRALRRVDAPIVGVALNAALPGTVDAYGYEYTYDDHEDELVTNGSGPPQGRRARRQQRRAARASSR